MPDIGEKTASGQLRAQAGLPQDNSLDTDSTLQCIQFPNNKIYYVFSNKTSSGDKLHKK